MKRFFVGLMVSFLLLGCKQEEPNPELRDPIFQDLSKKAADAQKSLDEALVKRKEGREKLEKTEPNSIELKDAKKELEKTESLVTRLQQDATYYRIRAERRKIVAKMTYREAFWQDKPWPDPREYSDYQLNIRLNQINLNWGTRVPRLGDKRAPAKESAEKAAPAAH